MSSGRFNDGAKDNELGSRAHTKRQLNQPMNLRELAAAYGMAYNRARSLSFEAGFPMVRGLVFPEAFEAWMGQGPRSRRDANPQPNAVGTVREPGRRSGSQASWRRIEQSLHAAGLLPE